MSPAGHAVDTLEVPGAGSFELTTINPANPAIFVDAAMPGLTGAELQADGNDAVPPCAVSRALVAGRHAHEVIEFPARDLFRLF